MMQFDHPLHFEKGMEKGELFLKVIGILFLIYCIILGGAFLRCLRKASAENVVPPSVTIPYGVQQVDSLLEFSEIPLKHPNLSSVEVPLTLGNSRGYREM